MSWIDKLLDRLPGWPTERQWVTAGVFGLALIMLLMARENQALWDVKLFEVGFQAVVMTGMLNMILAFHFAANKADEDKVANTAKAFEAITATAQASTPAAAAPIHVEPPATITETRTTTVEAAAPAAAPDDADELPESERLP